MFEYVIKMDWNLWFGIKTKQNLFSKKYKECCYYALTLALNYCVSKGVEQRFFLTQI